MGKIAKSGESFVYDGLILEAQESGPSCEHCFFLYEEEQTCTLNERAGVLPWCIDRDENKSIIYKYVREATDDEIKRDAYKYYKPEITKK